MESTVYENELKQKGNVTESVNPATGEIIGCTKEDTVEELFKAVKLAGQAQKEWAARSFAERAVYLFRIRDYIADNADKIAEIISKDNGKTRIDALSTEVFPVTMAISYYAKNASKILRRKRLRAGNILTINKRTYVDHVPYGVIGIISPWNYPFAIPFHEIAMALIAGNAAVLKVASNTLEVGKIIADCIKAGELPENLFALINIPGSKAGDAFIDSGINKLFFTGSVAVGKKLMKKASEKLTPVSLELGGNDAMIVLSDADLHRAAAGAIWAGFSNCGQSCAGVERIYAEEKIYDEFVGLLKNKLSLLKVGPDTGDFSVSLGSITTENQLATVKRHVADAIAKGACAFTAGGIDEGMKGLFHPAVILENVNSSMLVMQEETFGPVVGIEKVKNLDEAISKANDSSLGLTASIWTSNRKKAHYAASKLEAGSIMINDHLMSHGLAEVPWGGFKESGLGRTHSYLGLEEMTQPRAVIDDVLPLIRKNMWWHPHDKSVYDGLKGGIEFLYAGDLSKKFNGLLKLTKTFLRSFTK